MDKLFADDKPEPIVNPLKAAIVGIVYPTLVPGAKLTGPMAIKVNLFFGQLRKIQATAAEVERRWPRCVERYTRCDMPPTLQCLVDHWQEFAKPTPAEQGVINRESETKRQQEEHVRKAQEKRRGDAIGQRNREWAKGIPTDQLEAWRQDEIENGPPYLRHFFAGESQTLEHAGLLHHLYHKHGPESEDD